MNQTDEEFVRPEDTAAIREARLKALVAQKEAELLSREAELLQVRCCARYGIRDGDSFDLRTGKITRASQAMAEDVEVP